MFDHPFQDRIKLVGVDLFGDFYFCHKVQLQTLKGLKFGSLNDRRATAGTLARESAVAFLFSIKPLLRLMPVNPVLNPTVTHI
jgi:hypothetical protein